MIPADTRLTLESSESAELKSRVVLVSLLIKIVMMIMIIIMMKSRVSLLIKIMIVIVMIMIIMSRGWREPEVVNETGNSIATWRCWSSSQVTSDHSEPCQSSQVVLCY